MLRQKLCKKGMRMITWLAALGGGMVLTVGIDEAGYAPLAGPLVVAAVAIEGGPDEVESLLAKTPARIGDSKQIYGGKIENLEPVVLGLLDSPPESASLLVEHFCVTPPRPFYWRDFSIPFRRDPITPLNLPVRVRAWVITAERFNRSVRDGRSKSEILWEAVSDHIGWARGLSGSSSIICDRLGSRKDYARLLRQKFALATPLKQDGQRFLYRLADSTVTFCTDGDARYRVVGLASMVAKYLRELFMHALNRWLLERRLTTRPITGYADRALVREIAERLKRFGIDGDSFLRRL